MFGAVMLTLAACAAGTPDAKLAMDGGPFGQLALGFWHGLIAPITLIVEVVHRYFPHTLPLAWRLYQGGTAGGTVSVPYDIGFYFGLAGGPSFIFSRR